MRAPGDAARFVKFSRDVLTTEDGQPLVIHEYEQKMLADYFAGKRETLVLISKKNGKTSLFAALALFHLITTHDAECVIAAAARDQAAIMLRQIQGYIRRSAHLAKRVKVKQREVVHLSHLGRIRVLASNVDTADGVIPTLALVDELHRHKSSDLYGVLRDGLGPRDGQILTISTAGDRHDSPLGEMRKEAYAMPGMIRDGAYRYVTTDGFAMHEWALEPDQPRDDMLVVKEANPAPWQTVEMLRERFQSPTMTPWQWARLACGVWGLGAEPAFDPDAWDSLAKLSQPEPGRIITLGFDGARRRDGTGLVGADIENGQLFRLGYWERPFGADDEWEVPEEEVDEIVDHAFSTWNVQLLYGDPPYWESALDRWAGQYGVGKVVAWWTNRVKNTALAVRAFRNDMVPERMSHDGDEKLTEHIGNAVRKDTNMYEGDEQLFLIQKDSADSPRKIDLAMAALLAWKARGDAIAKGALSADEYESAQW